MSRPENPSCDHHDIELVSVGRLEFGPRRVWNEGREDEDSKGNVESEGSNGSEGMKGVKGVTGMGSVK
jgi:hypothetical protein